MKFSYIVSAMISFNRYTFAFFTISRSSFLKGIAGGGMLLMNSEEGSALTLPVDKRANKIHFYGDIDRESCALLRYNLDEAIEESVAAQSFYSLDNPFPVELHVQSTGGNVMSALAIVDQIANSPVPIHSYVEGFAASAATLWTISCHKRYASKNSLMLLHQLSASTEGKFDKMKEEVLNFELIMSLIENIYLENTSMNSTELKSLLSKDRWLSSNQCLEYGIIDEIIKVKH